jgi:hypothetical protein
MGVLDDAIRQHLELKRKHGATDEELDRQEAEALGPVRREVPETPEGEEAEAIATSEEPEAAEQLETTEPVQESPPLEAALVAEEPPLVEDAVPAEEDFSEVLDPLVPEHEQDAEATLDEDRTEVFEPEPAASEPEPAGDTPPRGFPAVDEPAEPEAEPAPGEPDSEDVLEETPDFLQETPEHDRLWFEQKPPRDFDFD